MFGIENFNIKLLLLLSAGFMLTWFIIILVRWILRIFDKLDLSTASYKRKLFLFSFFLIASIWCFKYAVGLSHILLLGNKYQLTKLEELFYSFIYSLHIFGVDDGFTDYISDVKKAMSILFGEKSCMICIGSVYASALSAIAPVAGGAIIFEIIASIFPNIQMKVSYWNIFRDKYYFSELNENSLALIKSINNEHKGKLFRPVSIITDSYIDDENETSVELLNGAKLLGAICVKNDIVHIKKNLFGKRKFFFIDEDEYSNIQKLIDLSRTMKKHYVKKSEFYPFLSSDVFLTVEKQIRKDFCDGDEEKAPVIIPINGYRNIILNMFLDLPLFEPIVHKYKEKKEQGKDTELNVTILGMGAIGTEMFLGTYWCGQMIGCKLNITVISKETEEDFKKKIDFLNPEIFRSACAGDPLLKIYRKDCFAPDGAERESEPYFSFKYIEADVKSDDFVGSLENNDYVKNTNYFFVALGSDNENILMANKLREIIGQGHMISDEKLRTVISYVVFDSNLCEALNENSLYSYSVEGNDIYMRALGSIGQLYSVRNVFLTEFDVDARKTHKKYYSSEAVKKRKEDSGSMSADAYSYASSVAKIVHRPYKMFSAGVWENSIFNCNEKEDVVRYEAQKKIYRENYVRKMLTCSKEKKYNVLHEFAWLEHRRWNAYLRSRGFGGPVVTKNDGKEMDAEKTLAYINRFLFIKKSHKQLDLKRHLCLVECSRRGLEAKIDECGMLSDYAVWNVSDQAEYSAIYPDMLDELEIIMSNENFKPHKDVPKKEFKRYDYPSDELGRYITASEFSTMTGISLKKIDKLYKKEKICNCLLFGEDNVLMIPEENIKLLKKRG